jgi:hypothetical protein
LRPHTPPGTWRWNNWDFVSLMVGMGALPADVIPRAFAGETARFG